jgi:hypothetical protein
MMAKAGFKQVFYKEKQYDGKIERISYHPPTGSGIQTYK